MCCGGGYPIRSEPKPQITQTIGELVRVEFLGNEQIELIGAVTGTSYGHRQYGEKFWMNAQDAVEEIAVKEL